MTAPNEPIPRSEPPDDPGNERLLGSRCAFDGQRVRVRVDAVRLPSGRETVREVVEHPGAVAVVAITDDGRLLLILQHHHAIGRTLLGIPAGTLDPDEDPAATARRELVEETGYAAGRLTELAAFYTSPGYTDERLIVFLAEDCVPTGGGPNPDELISLAPVPLADLPALLEPGAERIEGAKTLIGLLSYLRRRSVPAPRTGGATAESIS